MEDREPETARRNTAAKIVSLLEALASSEQPLGVRELARVTGIDKSVISRLFGQLEDMGILEQQEAQGRFMIGPRLFALAASIRARDNLWKAAKPILAALAERFQETCYLTIREQYDVIFLEKIDSEQTIRYVIPLGQRSPLHAGAGGRAILAGMTHEEVEHFLATSELAALTANTITDTDELRRQVKEDRHRGYSVSMGERVARGSAVAAPYYSADGRCWGSVVFTCPAERLDVRRIPEIADTVVAASRELSVRLGHPPDRP